MNLPLKAKVFAMIGHVTERERDFLAGLNRAQRKLYWNIKAKIFWSLPHRALNDSSTETVSDEPFDLVSRIRRKYSTGETSFSGAVAMFGNKPQRTVAKMLAGDSYRNSSQSPAEMEVIRARLLEDVGYGRGHMPDNVITEISAELLTSRDSYRAIASRHGVDHSVVCRLAAKLEKGLSKTVRWAGSGPE